MSDTPRTDKALGYIPGFPDTGTIVELVDAEFARQLERELAAAKDEEFASGTAAKCWYEAASPYATPAALKEALFIRPEVERTVTVRLANAILAGDDRPEIMDLALAYSEPSPQPQEGIGK